MSKTKTTALTKIDPPEVFDAIPAQTLDGYIDNLRISFDNLKLHFRDNVIRVAKDLEAVKRKAKADGVNFDDLFTDPKWQMPFGRTAAFMYLSVAKGYKDGTLTKYADLLPADVTVQAKLVSVKPAQREAVLAEYLKLVSIEDPVVVIDGEVVEKPKTKQDAMTKAKKKIVTKEPEQTPEEPKAPVKPEAPKKPVKAFNAPKMARDLHKSLGNDGLSELADAIEMLLCELGVRE